MKPVFIGKRPVETLIFEWEEGVKEDLPEFSDVTTES